MRIESRKKFLKDARAISPLIATLLLIAISVASSVITYSWVMSMVGSQSQQAQTQVMIDNITWYIVGDSLNVTVRNTGSVSATVVSISVRLSASGSPFYTKSFATGNSIATARVITLAWTETAASAPTNFLKTMTEYVIRVTTTTGFQYEMVATTPLA